MDPNDLLDDNFGEEENGISIELTSVKRFILFNTLSLSLYSIWYMYYIWNFLKKKDRLNIMPIGRAIFAIFFFYDMCEWILDFAKSKKYPKSYFCVLLFIGFITFPLLTRLPDPYWMISLFSFVVFIQPINAFNYAVLNSSEYKGEIKTGFSQLQMVLMILGIIIWALILIGVFL